MANYTKKIILHTFEEMLDEMPFGKITVSALVARCEISSNTFYYHFKDIFDLLEFWLDRRTQAYLKQIENTPNWAEGLKIVLHELKKHSRTIYHISESISREWLERYVFNHVEQQFHTDLEQRTAGLQVDKQIIDKVASFYCYAFLGFFIKFLWGDMKADIDTSVDDLCRIFDGILSTAIQRIKDEASSPSK